MFKLTAISIILFVTTAINAGGTIISWRRRDAKGGFYFAWAMTAITGWTLASALDYAAIPISLKVLFAKGEYVFYHAAFVFFLMFSLSYAGREAWLKKAWVQGVLWAIPVINSLLAWTNEWHGWIWSGFTRNEMGDNVVIFHHGPGFAWVAASNYLAIGLIFLNLWHAMRRSSELTRQQARLLIGATLIPVLGNLLYLLEIVPSMEGVDWTSLLFSFSGILFLMALYGTRLLDVVPVARHLILERIPDCILVLDMTNRVIDFNLAAQEKFSLQKKDLGQSVDKVMARWPNIIRLANATATQTIPLSLILHEPGFSIFDTRLTRLEDDRGQLYAKLILFRNMTLRYKVEQDLKQRLGEIEELHKKMQELAERDSLTHAYTRRYLHDQLSALLESEPPEHRFVVALLDIDKFKQVNDTYGHAAGDEMLVALVEILFSRTRKEDTVCRYGGEEFVIILPFVPVAQAVMMLEQICEDFQQWRLPESGTGTTISIGLAEYPTHSRGRDEVLNLADRAMYQAKQAGGNRVVVCSNK